MGTELPKGTKQRRRAWPGGGGRIETELGQEWEKVRKQPGLKVLTVCPLRHPIGSPRLAFGGLTMTATAQPRARSRGRKNP